MKRQITLNKICGKERGINYAAKKTKIKLNL